MPSKSLKLIFFLILALSLLNYNCNSETKTDKLELFPISKNSLMGYINKKGVIIIGMQFEQAKPFYEGLAAVQKDGKWGYIDVNGKFVIENKYFSVSDFKEGLAYVTPNHRNSPDSLIDKKGNILLDAIFIESHDFSEGLTMLYEFNGDPTWSSFSGFINKDGELIIKSKWDFAQNFSEGYAAVYIDAEGRSNISGFIDKSGEYVINLEERVISDFHDGLAWQLKNDEYSYINKTGSIVIDNKTIGKDYRITTSYDFSEGLARVKLKYKSEKSKTGYINTKGNLIVKPLYQQGYDFSEGLAAVQNKDKWGFINKEGKVVIDFLFYKVESFRNGLAKIYERENRKEKWGYINKKGDVIWKPTI